MADNQQHADREIGDDAGPTYEETRAELVDVVRRLEAGGTTLEESLALWERGERLARACQEWLDGARQRLDEVLGEDEDLEDEEEDLDEEE